MNFDFAANEITHCVRPEDVQCRRAVIVLRRVHPFAPRLSFETNDTSLFNYAPSSKRHSSLLLPDELSVNTFMRFYKTFSKNCKHKNTFGGVCKPYCIKKNVSNIPNRYGNQPYKL
ncbi:hypothetical protein NQ314_019079 [Rhamnusium bicolor]|uniref:Uncharacterized protein n=1 Tax=Rhamnusium bicolor TaxID=1586634 RepID=A0AAV8WPC2_9CUCU|nr:hypothetical protein NQ314_019079 [Rhamnusium bicolor]